MADNLDIPALEIEILHNLHGDKKKCFDTHKSEGRKEAEVCITKMLREGTALFLERGRKTYRISRYNAKTDKLVVHLEGLGGREVAASSAKGVKTAVPPRAGG